MKNIQIIEGLDSKHLPGITKKYHSDHRKRRCKLKNHYDRILINKKLAKNIIKDCRTESAQDQDQQDQDSNNTM